MTVASIVLLSMLFLQCCTSSFALCSTDFADEDDYPYKHFQRKTLYDSVRGELTRASRPENCSPKSVVMFLRHGSRHPGAAAAGKFGKLVDLVRRVNVTGNAELCKHDLEKITSWKNWHQPLLDKDVAVTGYDEMKGIAERFSQVFPELFLRSASHRFISSSKRRAVQSAEAFREALPDRPLTDIEIDNMLSRFHDFCKRFQTQILRNDSVLEDVHRFMDGPFVTEIADKFSRRLGIPRDEVSNHLVSMVKTTGCSEEEWAIGKSSAWCLAFTKQDFQALEYGEDMSDYFLWSFGHELSHKQSCGTKNFILSKLKEASTGDTTTGIFVFSHFLGLMSLLTEMKIIEDDGPFRSRDYPEKLDRNFRVSMYVPGSGNLAIVLYDCDGESKVQTFLNEKLVQFNPESSTDDGLLNLESALRHFGYYDPNDCQFDEMCGNIKAD